MEDERRVKPLKRARKSKRRRLTQDMLDRQERVFEELAPESRQRRRDSRLSVDYTDYEDSQVDQ